MGPDPFCLDAPPVVRWSQVAAWYWSCSGVLTSIVSNVVGAVAGGVQVADGDAADKHLNRPAERFIYGREQKLRMVFA